MRCCNRRCSPFEAPSAYLL